MKKIAEIKNGQRFIYGNIEWVKLDKKYGGAFVLAVNKQADSAFDNNKSNNWATSSLRKDLNATKNGRFTTITLKDVNKDDIIEFGRDLTTDDGMTDYGTCTDIVSLLTCDEYRKYRKFIPNCGKWHWTITADSLEYSCYVRCVGSGGSLDGAFAHRGRAGVRPVIVLKNDVEVEVVEE